MPAFDQRVLVDDLNHRYCRLIAVLATGVRIPMREQLPRKLLLQLDQPFVEEHGVFPD